MSDRNECGTCYSLVDANGDSITECAAGKSGVDTEGCCGDCGGCFCDGAC